ncbi:MAG: MFS transporter [Beutenbergiaceae bacterium]
MPGDRGPTPLAARARVAIVLAFVGVGLLLAVWLVHIPVVQGRAELSHDALGFALLALGAGSFVAMQLAGVTVSRLGAKPVVVAGLTLMATTLILPALAWDVWSLSVALFCFGAGNGLCEVSMNAEAVEIEADIGRPIMSSFHAMFSVGTAVGAGLGALLQATPMGIGASFGLVCALGVALAVAVALLLPARDRARFGAREEATTSTSAAPNLRLRIVIMAVLAFLLFLAEGVANDWSALHAGEQFNVSTSAAAFAYGTFAVSMTVGRLVIDRIVLVAGPVRVVRYGSALAALGLVVVMLSSQFALALAGWAIFALGLAGVVPQIFSSAGNLPVARRPVILSRVVGAGYIGLLAGPAIVGFFAEAWTLNTALILPVLVCVFGVVTASVVAPVATPAASTSSR